LQSYRDNTSACHRILKRRGAGRGVRRGRGLPHPNGALPAEPVARGETDDQPLNFFQAFPGKSAADHPVYGTIVCRMPR
jgi:hypothetical protein